MIVISSKAPRRPLAVSLAAGSMIVAGLMTPSAYAQSTWTADSPHARQMVEGCLNSGGRIDQSGATTGPTAQAIFRCVTPGMQSSPPPRPTGRFSGTWTADDRRAHHMVESCSRSGGRIEAYDTTTGASAQTIFHCAGVSDSPVAAPSAPSRPQGRSEDGAGPRAAPEARPPATLPALSTEGATLAPLRSGLPPQLPAASAGVTLAPDQLFARVQDSVWVVIAAASAEALRSGRSVAQGSAVAISRDRLLTNCHVLAGRPLVMIAQRERTHAAFVVSGDTVGDRCVLALRDTSLAAVPGIRSFADLRIGERVYSIGAPSGLELTLGEGLVSGKRVQDNLDYVQTSAPISPGSSGGGLFDSRGNLVGITTFLLRNAQNLNFAIAADAYWR